MNAEKSNPEGPVRIGVLGAGLMGKNHLRIYDLLKGVDVVGIVDPDEMTAKAVSETFGCKVFPTLEAMAGEVDAVSVCTPSSLHAEIGLECLGAGLHCMIEKPLATNEEDCLKLIEAADKAGVKLLVGHIERFNPAVQQLSAMLNGGQAVHAIDSRRLSSVSQRITDVDVVADLMVHDIDIVLSLIRSPLAHIAAEAVRGRNGADHVNALLRFENGAIACLTASRITQHKVRRLSVTTSAGFVEVDYVNQSLDVYVQDEIKRVANAAQEFGDYKAEILMDRVFVRRGEPLYLELAHFADIIRNDGQPIVTGQDSLEVMRVVRRIQDLVA